MSLSKWYKGRKMQSKSALEGIKVIDLTQWVAGPMAAELLAQWGAEVIHIEHPIRSDASRGLQAGAGVANFPQHRVNYAWELPNMNKKSLTADLNQKEGREIIYRLVAKSDVFLVNLRPREIEKFEMHYETLKKINPMIIYAGITGYGMKGPDKDAPAWDTTAYFARSGIMHMLTEPGGVPTSSRPGLGDLPVGMFCACGIMVALLARERLGLGQAVYTSLYECGVWTLQVDTQGALLTHQDIETQRRESVSNPLSNFYKTKDNRWIRLNHLQPDPYWKNFCQAIEREDIENEPRFNSLSTRAENSAVLINIIDEAFAKRTLEEWKARLLEFGLIFSPVQKPTEVINDPQAKANDFFETFTHPVYGPIELVSAPIKLSETPGTLRTPAPEFGQNTEEILLELGYNWNEISRLRDKKVIA